MNYGRAFGAGVIGAAVMTVLMALGRMTGLTTMNLEMALGSMFTGMLDAGTWVVGLIAHFITGGILALGYAAIFEFVAHYAGSGLGAGIGAIHAAASGLIIAMMPAVHPLMESTPDMGILPPPGPFGINYGVTTAAAFVILHIVYGAIVGGSYIVREPREEVLRQPRAA